MEIYISHGISLLLFENFLIEIEVCASGIIEIEVESSLGYGEKKV